MRSAPIRVQLEQRLRDRYCVPFRFSQRPQPETALTGIEAVDQLSRGLPRGRITEIFGKDSSGRTTLLLSALAQITEKEEVCGLIDPAGTFDPTSAATIGVDLERLLWIRTGRDIDQTLKATDLLLQGGGFGLIGVDLGEFPLATVRRIPLSSWFRLQRAVEDTPTILLFLNRDSSLKTCASLVLRLQLDCTDWSPHLFRGIRPRVEIIRSKTDPTASWNNASQRFWIPPANYFQAVANRPVHTPFIKEASSIEGVSCHES